MTELNGAAIRVRDPERAESFYCGLLGFKELSRFQTDDGIVCVLEINSAQQLTLTAGGDTELLRTAVGVYPTGFHHLCFETDNIEEDFARLSEAGCYVEQGLMTGTDRNRQFWLRDPDGYPVEFMQMSPDAMQYMKEGS